MTTKSVELTMDIKRDGDFWVAFAREIPVSDFARTQAEAFARTHDAIHAWLKAYAQEERLEEILTHYHVKIEEAEDEVEEVPTTPAFSHKYLVPA